MTSMGLPASGSPRGSIRPWHALTAVVLMLACASVDARLIRGGGRGSSTIVGSMQFAGTSPFLIPDPNPADNAEAPTGADGTTDLKNAAAYGYGGNGLIASVTHDWGRDCAVTTECFFELAESEQLQWQANLLGLPEVSVDPYLAVADVLVSWSFYAVEELPPGLTTTGPQPSRVLFTLESLFGADEFGNYDAGTGSGTVSMGGDLGYAPAADDFDTSGCYASWPPNLAPEQVYSYGSCRKVGLDLAEDGGLSGADLDAMLLDDEYLALLVSVQLTAPADAQFASFYDPSLYTDPFLTVSQEASDLLADGEILPVADSLRAVTGLDYWGCPSPPGSNCEIAVASSDLMRINVVPDAIQIIANPVPAPSTLWLLSGALLLLRTRRAR